MWKLGDRRRRLLVAWNVALAVLTTLSWLAMLMGWFGMDALLSTSGLGSLRYYTVLANLLSGGASAWFAVDLVRRSETHVSELAKLAATTSVMVTFLVTAVFLGPTMGYAFLYMGPNFFLHLVLPLMALAELLLLWPRQRFSLRDTLVATVPTFAYACFYYGNILVNGVGEGPNSNDWYGFAAWGVGYLPVVFVVVLLVAWVMALAIMALNRKAAR